MYRSDRYFGKNDGEHNFFGEEEYIEVKKEGVVRLDLKKTGSSPQETPKSKEEDSGGG